MKTQSAPSPRPYRRRLLALGLLLLVLWLTLFDSHSLLKRVQWHREHAALVEENEELRRRIDELEAALEEGLSDEVVERIAREQYGMRRPDETVYRVAPED